MELKTAHVRFGEERNGPAYSARSCSTGRLVEGRAPRRGAALERTRAVDSEVPWHGVDDGGASFRVRVEPGDRATVVLLDGELSLEELGYSTLPSHASLSTASRWLSVAVCAWTLRGGDSKQKGFARRSTA